MKPRDVASSLALATNSAVVQVIGRTATLFRENPDSIRRAAKCRRGEVDCC